MAQNLPDLTWIFYLATPMDRSEYVRIKISNIPSGFIEEYNLKTFLIMDQCILKFSGGAIVYPKVAS